MGCGDCLGAPGGAGAAFVGRGACGVEFGQGGGMVGAGIVEGVGEGEVGLLDGSRLAGVEKVLGESVEERGVQAVVRQPVGVVVMFRAGAGRDRGNRMAGIRRTGR